VVESIGSSILWEALFLPTLGSENTMAHTKEEAEWAAAADSLYDDEIKLHHAAAVEAIKTALQISPRIWNWRASRKRCEDLVVDLTDLRVKILSCSVRWNLQLNDLAKLGLDRETTPHLRRGLEKTANGLRSARDATQDAESVVGLRLSQSVGLWTNTVAWLAIAITVILGGISIWVTLYPQH
jgi:hypothetical protein